MTEETKLTTKQAKAIPLTISYSAYQVKAGCIIPAPWPDRPFCSQEMPLRAVL